MKDKEVKELECREIGNGKVVDVYKLVRPLLEKWEKRIVHYHIEHYRECIIKQEETKRSEELRGMMDSTTECFCELKDIFLNCMSRLDGELNGK